MKDIDLQLLGLRPCGSFNFEELMLAAFERTFYRAVGAEDTAVTGPRAHDRMAIHAFVKIEARVRWNRLNPRVTAVRTGNQRFHAASNRGKKVSRNEYPVNSAKV